MKQNVIQDTFDIVKDIQNGADVHIFGTDHGFFGFIESKEQFKFPVFSKEKDAKRFGQGKNKTLAIYLDGGLTFWMPYKMK